MAEAARPYQIVVWGATGYTGRFVCERFAREYPGQLRLGLGGRDRAKLEALRDDMTEYDASFQKAGILIASADDRDAVDALTRSTDVVVSLAGPYSKYSSTVVASCVENGTHFLDITVEIPWVRENIRKYHTQAMKNKAKIVHFCGVVALPMDMVCLLLATTFRERYQTLATIPSEKGCRLVEQFFLDSKGSFSGGSAATVTNLYSKATPEELKAIQDPYNLTPTYLKFSHAYVPRGSTGSGFSSRSGKRFDGMRYSKDAKGWMVPSIFGRAGIPAVLRSNALAKEPYGKDFYYREGLKASNWISAQLTKAAFGLLDMFVQYSFLQGWLKRMAHKPGTGPDVEKWAKGGHWEMLFVGYPEIPSPTAGEEPPKPIFIKMGDSSGDPGYWSTSKMLVECALSLVFDKRKVDAAAAYEGGVLTPALAFGLVPLERLKQSGFKFEELP